ncbi:MAG: hypothetical protein HeimC2_05540 [Candidatus Heimdallarchaeota archaeon LC_2]|nr:MAG: hypothetical protein HeimC2_05540 [Candidatus Heimdallarchaeota archaeon LC_2]
MSLFILVLTMVFLLGLMSFASELLALGSEILEVKFGAGFVGSVILGFRSWRGELVVTILK